MNIDKLKEKDKQYIANTYNRFDLSISKGAGSKVFDGEKKYIDFGSGIAVSTFGLCDREWVEAITKQANTLSHTSNLYYTNPSVDLAEKLCKKASMQKVFFSNSGAEANETAIKCARKYSYDKYGDDRYEIITLKNSFHGRTMATLSATGQDSMHKYFNPFLDGFKYADANDIESIKKVASDKTCAIMFELVQGEGGVNVLDPKFVAEVCAFAKANDILTIVDEVQTGNGRCGSYFAYMQYGIKPDIVTTAKGLGGGLPIGAVLMNEKTENVFDFGSHGSTFGANPICCAGAISVVDRLDEKFLKTVTDRSNYIVQKLKNIEKIKSVSGLGLMLGLEIDVNAKQVAIECMEKGLLVLTAKNKVRLLPALNISYQEIDKGIEILAEVLK